ncbi:MAG: ABC transporter permease [Streptosporangiaceae bacterium]
MTMEITVAEIAAPPDAQAALRELTRRRRRRRAYVWLWRVIILAAVLVTWQLSSGHWFPAFVMSSPIQVWDRLREWVSSGYILDNLGVTLEETFIGFAAGTLIGAAAGLLIGLSRFASEVLSPFINALYAVPKIMLGPLFVVWFGIDLTMKSTLAGLFVVFIVFYNIWSGVQEVDQDLVEMFRVMGAGRWAIIRGIYLPSALSWLFNSLRLAFPVALIGATVGEFIASSAGLGFVATNAANQADTTGVFVAVIVVTIVAVAMDQVIVLVQRMVNRRLGKNEGGRLVI